MTRAELIENPQQFLAAWEKLIGERDLLKEKNTLLTEQVKELSRQIQQLKSYVAKALYGKKSERDIEGQLGLPFDDDLEGAKAIAIDADVREEKAEPAPEEPAKKKIKRGGRTVIPEHLPRERQVHKMSREELEARFGKGNWRETGEEVREELDYKPGSMFVIEHVTKKYASNDRNEAPVRASAPRPVIAKGRPGAGLLAHIIVSKFADHLPLYRIDKIFRRQGLAIPRTTLCHWMQQTAFILEGIVRVIKHEILASGIVRTDDTGVTMLDSSAKGGSKRAHIWPYMSHDGQIVFDFTESRSRAGPKAFLGDDYEGFLQADAANLYDRVFGELVTEVACWAHARRRFFKVREQSPDEACHALALIKNLYAIERQAKDEGLSPDAVRVLRQEKSVPVLESIHEWLTACKKDVLPSSGIGDAVAYALKHFEALTNYTLDGRLAIDNNDVERAIRQIAVGRKNFLFFGGQRGGEVAATLYSLVANCQIEEINPFEYFRDVLMRSPGMKASDASSLTPRRWKQARDDSIHVPATTTAH